jgi:hypothetical protein
VIPFAEADRVYSDPETDAIYATDHHVQTRLKHYRAMIGRCSGSSLDVGAPNPVGKALGAEDNTDPTADFNFAVTAPRMDYQTILCFEVLEHVMNPLLLLSELRKRLGRTGRLYLSTPVLGSISWYQHKDHFTEYKLKNLRLMIDYAGFEIEAEDVFCPYPPQTAFRGVRPVLRVLFHRNALFCLRRK